MKNRNKIALAIVSLLALIFIVFSITIAPIATGYPAKYLCSSVYVNKMNPDTVWSHYIKPENPIFRLVDYTIEEDSRTVEVKLYGLILPSRAKFTEGCGCTLLGEGDKILEKIITPDVARKSGLDSLEWPLGSRTAELSGINKLKQEKLKARIEQEFDELTNAPRKNTWAVAVVYDNQLWAERYMEGLNKYTPLLSWSASKSLTGTLAGRWFTLSGEHWEQKADLPVAEANNPSAITWKDLLQMQDGLSFSEVYQPFSDATTMLYKSDNMALYASAKKQAFQPGTHWSYSSGTTNILSWLVKGKAGGNQASFEQFARSQFLDLLGIDEAIFEYDGSGTFVGSSYFHASPQSWLKIGMLYKNRGKWLGNQLLSEEWVDFALSPASDSKGRYGAQIWLNKKTRLDDKQLFPSLPEDTFMFQGYQGQYIVVIPSWDLMVVRMGVMRDPQWKMEKLILDINDILEN